MKVRCQWSSRRAGDAVGTSLPSHKQKSARPIETERRSINQLRKQVSKFDAKIVRRGNYIIFQTAEAAPWSIHRRRRGD